MRSFKLLSLLPLVQAVRIIQSNDDGWAEINARTFFNVLATEGHDVVLSGPAENQSGKSSLDAPPTTVTNGCQYDSCPQGSPPTGANSSDPRLNYVNSYPVTAIKRGIEVTGPALWGGQKPEIAVSGPNVGSNTGISVPFSGTVGAAVQAVKSGIPAIAFSGATGDPTAWNQPVPTWSRIYADLANNVTQTVLETSTPYLPANVWLNVNFPATTSTACTSTNNFKFVLSRIYWNPLATDVETCGSKHLPTESDVTGKDGCYVAISIGDASDKTDINDVAVQKQVLDKLAPILTCLP